MEYVDRHAEAPTLISNLEVMTLLGKNIAEREQQSKDRTDTNKKSMQNRKHRHRDWIESAVYDYLKTTPCGTLDPKHQAKVKAQLRSSSSSDGGFGLTDAESIQVLNMMPSEPVEIHLMLDELQSRMTENQQEKFLSWIASHKTNNQQDGVAPMTEKDNDIEASAAATSAPAVEAEESETSRADPMDEQEGNGDSAIVKTKPESPPPRKRPRRRRG